MFKLYRKDNKKHIFDTKYLKVAEDIKYTYEKIGRGKVFAIRIIDGSLSSAGNKQPPPKEAA